MTYRNLIEISETNEFKLFIIKYNLDLITVDDRLLILSKCFIIDIYGFNVEDVIYFDVFSKDLNLTSSIFTLLSEKDAKRMIDIRDDQKRSRVKIVSTIANNINKDTALRAEQFFFTYINIMDELLGDFFMCYNNNYFKFFIPNFEQRKKELEQFFKI
jgi:hypothetical protein